MKGVNIITHVCATADSITFYCLFFFRGRGGGVIPWELIIEVTLNEKIVLFFFIMLAPFH